jgi:hypothetical protein
MKRRNSLLGGRKRRDFLPWEEGKQKILSPLGRGKGEGEILIS